MSLPEQLLLSDLLRRKVRCDQGLDQGGGVSGWMHPPVHRLLGWVSRPSALSRRRLVWRLDQLRGLGELEAYVQGPGAETEAAILERLPTLFGASLIGAAGEMLGTVSDAAVELRSGRIRHYLVSRSDPRLPGSSRWRLSPERIVDQQPGRVVTALQGLDDLPLARASVRQEFLRRSRRWRDQMGEESSRLRDRFQAASGRFEQRLEGWLEEPPWDEQVDGGLTASSRRPPRSSGSADSDPLQDWSLDEGPSQRDEYEQRPWSEPRQERQDPPWPAQQEPEAAWPAAEDAWPESSRPPSGRQHRRRSDPRDDRFRGRDPDDDPWI
ncbi:MAG: RNA methyltransferase [Cyanobium sp.]